MYNIFWCVQDATYCFYFPSSGFKWILHNSKRHSQSFCVTVFFPVWKYNPHENNNNMTNKKTVILTKATVSREEKNKPVSRILILPKAPERNSGFQKASH